MRMQPHTKTRRLPKFEPGMTYISLPARTAQWCQRLAEHGRKVLIFTQCECSAALVQRWWPVDEVAHLPIWLDDTPNVTPGYIKAQVQAHGPVRFVVIHGWELLLFADGTPPQRSDPTLLQALDDVARSLQVSLVVHSAIPNRRERLK